jgi:tetratricopeptide (TPR) repeat protein
MGADAVQVSAAVIRINKAAGHSGRFAAVVITALMFALSVSARAQSIGNVVRSIERNADAGAAAALRRSWTAAERDPQRKRLAGLALATLARLAYDYRLADSLYSSLIPAPATRPDPVSVRARLGLGASLGQRWRAPEADSALSRALEEGTAIGDRAVEVEALVRLALLRGRTVGVPAGLALLDRAERMRARADTVGRLQVLTTRAQLLLARGDTGAVALAEEARRVATKAKRPRVEGLVLQILAREQYRRGKVDSAIALYGRSARLLEPVNERVGYAVALQWRGFLLRNRGDFGAARQDLERALGAGDAAGALTLGWVRLNLGEIALAIGDWHGAYEQLMQARSLLAGVGDRWGLANALHSEALSRRALHEWGASDSLLTAAEQQLVASGNRSDVLSVRLERLRNALTQRDWATAARLLAGARDSAVASASVVPLDIEYYSALLSLEQGQPRDALRELLRGQTNTKVLPSYQRIARTAEAYAMIGQLDSAEAWGRAALDRIDRWRLSQQPRQERLAALVIHGDVDDPGAGIATVTSALAADGRVVPAFEFAERLASHELLGAMLKRESLRLESTDRTVVNRLNVALAPNAAATPVTLHELQTALPESTAVVSFVTGTWGEPSTAIVITRDRSRAIALASTDSLIGAINTFHASLQSGVWPRPLARRLGDAILAPVAAVVPPGVTRLIVIGGTVLQTLPFDALELADGRAAIERFEISYAPSASVAALLVRRARRGADGGLLSLGASARPTATGHPAWDSLPPLPGAAREARRVADFFVHSDVRVGNQAAESWLKGPGGRNASVVHVAAHTIVDPSSMGETALLLVPGGGQDGIVRPEELGALALAADLVVLSGCRTTRADISYGDEGYRGLVTPLFEAGARTVVATVWPVDDARQIVLVERFYRELAGGATAGAALRAAKLAAFRGGASPREWASLVLWGDPATRPSARMRRPLMPRAILGRTFGSGAVPSLNGTLAATANR